MFSCQQERSNTWVMWKIKGEENYSMMVVGFVLKQNKINVWLVSTGWHACHNSLITNYQRQSTLRNTRSEICLSLRVQEIFLKILKAEWVQDWLLNFAEVKLLLVYSGINMFNRISSLRATATKRNNFTCLMKSRDLVCRLKERAFENCDLKSCWENRILQTARFIVVSFNFQQVIN